MRKNQVIKHFGSESEVSRLLNISRQAVNKWGEVVPIRHAWTLERASGGRVALRIQDYRTRFKKC
ncbi:MAG: hypothetical protein GY938_13280 [Ketobacter sp.]|nr:hypothetical protein [Ketobacter sp.]